MSPGDTIHIVIPQSAPDTSVTATAAAAPTSTSTVTTNAPTPKEMREYYQKKEDEGIHLLIHPLKFIFFKFINLTFLFS